MENVQLEFLLLFVCVLSLPTAKGTYEQCLTSLTNTVVYEGTLNTMMTCADGNIGAAWSVRPSSDSLTIYNITNFAGIVNSSLTRLYAIDETGLIVLSATGNKTGGLISTAGAYTIEFESSTNKIAVKLVVIRSGPSCYCNQLASGKVIQSCTVIYADHPTTPINAVMQWTLDGQPYTTSKPIRTFSCPNVWNSTATITVPESASGTYECTVKFVVAPYPSPSYLVKNAPAFSATCTECSGTTVATTTEEPTTTEPIIPTEEPTTPEPITTTTTEEPTTTGPIITTEEPTTPEPIITTEEPTTPEPITTTTEPPSTTLTTTTKRPPTTTKRSTTTTKRPTTTTKRPTTTTKRPTTTTKRPTRDCKKTKDIYENCVVKAELYERSDDLHCGVVVTIQNGSRWLIHDLVSTDNICRMVAVDASSMSSDWIWLDKREVTVARVGDYVREGNSVNIGRFKTDCSKSCKRMILLL